MMEAALKQLEARARHDVADRPHVLREISVCVGAGRFDVLAPPRNAEAIARLTNATRFELYEGGHLFFFQDPQAFRDLASFLA
jgi:3-oxoadipate enol-lactonase